MAEELFQPRKGGDSDIDIDSAKSSAMTFCVGHTHPDTEGQMLCALGQMNSEIRKPGQQFLWRASRHDG